MEIKKSHKADLEHRRPWMFVAGLTISVVAFVVALNLRLSTGNEEDEWDDDVFMDLNLKKEDRDMISAAEKKRPKEEEKKETDKINKVDEVTEQPPEIFDQIKFEPKIEEDKELEEELKNEPINQNPDDPEILRIVEELPQFPGGMVEFMKWLTNNLHYPQAALRNKIQGRVMVTFIVEKDGSITNMAVSQKANTYLDNEALRVLSKMPKWKPGKDKGEICRTKVAVPVVFAI